MKRQEGRTTGGYVRYVQRVNSGGEFESVSLRRCNPMGRPTLDTLKRLGLEGALQ